MTKFFNFIGSVLKKSSVLLYFFGITPSAQADTIANYMTISNNITAMSMKPDEQSQAWVRSAQRILTSTDETLAQTVVAMNTVAAKQSQPIFCFPQGGMFDGGAVHEILQRTYTELLKSQGTAVANMNISDVLMLGMITRYACSPTPASNTGSAMPAPALPANSLAGQPVASTPVQQLPVTQTTSTPVLPPPVSTSGLQNNNPFGSSPTQQTVSANSPPAL